MQKNSNNHKASRSSKRYLKNTKKKYRVYQPILLHEAKIINKLSTHMHTLQNANITCYHVCEIESLFIIAKRYFPLFRICPVGKIAEKAV